MQKQFLDFVDELKFCYNKFCIEIFKGVPKLRRGVRNFAITNFVLKSLQVWRF